MTEQRKIERRKTNLFSKNDIYRFIGIILVIAGQFMPSNLNIDKEGLKAATNISTAFGIFIFSLPFWFRYLQNKKSG